jgi:hypothetical protein
MEQFQCSRKTRALTEPLVSFANRRDNGVRPIASLYPRTLSSLTHIPHIPTNRPLIHQSSPGSMV